MYVDLESILEEESRYQDPGAYAIENLYAEGKGFFDWTTEDDLLKWDVSYQICTDLENDTNESYQDLPKIEGVDDMIEFEIQQFINGEIELPTEVVRFKVIYSLKDKADNVGSASRIVELRGSPNLYPHIYFTLNHEDNNKGVPISDGENKTSMEGINLPSLTWQVEVG